MQSNRRVFVLNSIALGASAAFPAFGQSEVPTGGNLPARTLGKLVNVRLEGELGTRYQAATGNLLTRQDRYSLDVFRCNALGIPEAIWEGWPWPGDLIGRYLSNLHVASALGWTPARKIRADILDTVLPLQRRHGNFGPDPPDPTDVEDISGNAFALRGLMDAYADTHDERTLEAARRMGRFFEASFDYYKARRQGSVHEFYGHCADGLVRLYEQGGDKWALELAQQIASRASRAPHTHHALSMYRGVLDLYRITGNEDYLRRTLDYLEWVRANRIMTGGVPEEIPKSYEDEGCALADYLLVNLMTFAATGKDSFLEEAENTLVNHFFMNQFHTGGFGHRLYDSEVVGGKGWQGWHGKHGSENGSENPGCCSLWGQWALGNVGQFILTRKGRALEVNLYPAGEVSFPELGLTVHMTSDFPRMRQAALVIYTTERQPVELRLRVPRWAESMNVEVNGSEVPARLDDGRLSVRRPWRSGDVVGIQFKSSLRLVPWPQADSPLVGVFDGPLCLALSSTDADVDADWRLATTADGTLALNSAGQPVLVGETRERIGKLRPLENDWLSVDVLNPRRLRVLFRRVLAG